MPMSEELRIRTPITFVLRLLVTAVLAVVIVPPVAAAVGITVLLRAPLPGELPDERPSFEAVPSRAYDRDGNEIAVFRGFDRTIEIQPSDVPQVMRDAVVAIEDQRFFQHDGVDLEGIARAARTNLEVGSVAQGGSTITQQYVKNTYLSGEQTFERKAREALLAIEIEQQMTKDEILFAYLETSYYGAGAYGIGAAAEVYFSKPVDELDLSEAATLAGVLQSPSRLSPREDIEAADERRRVVLQAMLDVEMITVEEYEREVPRTLWSETDSSPPSGLVTVVSAPPVKGATAFPFFVDWIEAELLERVGPDALYRGGLEIHTTIDPTLQAMGEAAVAERLTNTEAPVDMSLVSIDPRTGEVLVMVGGRDYASSQVNLATGGSTGFQPGSSFKPIVMAEAFRQGIAAEDLRPAPGSWVVPGCTGAQCTITNYDGADRGEISLRDAMISSVNTVFAQLIDEVSIASTAQLANQLGLSRVDPEGAYGPSLALGSAETSPLEMASAYGTFAFRGVRHEPIGILRVLDADGQVLIDQQARPGQRIFDANVADSVSDVLQAVVTEGTGGSAAVAGRPVAGKTGTTQSYWAAWFVGYTPSLSTAVWMGHTDGLASLYNVNGVGRVTGGSHPAVAFSDFMSSALSGTPVESFVVPRPITAPVAETYKPLQERTVVGGRDQPVSVSPDCDGPCERTGVPEPDISGPPPTTVPTTTTSTSTTTPTTATPPTTTPGSTSSTDGQGPDA